MTLPKNNLLILLSKQFTSPPEKWIPVYIGYQNFFVKFCLNTETHIQTHEQIQHFLNFIIKYVPTDWINSLLHLEESTKISAKPIKILFKNKIW